MALSNYSELKTSIVAWSSRADQAADLDDFIALTEAKFWQVLRVRAMENRLSLASSSRFIPLPSGFLELRSVSYVSGATRKRLEAGTPNGMKVDSSSGIPSEYVISDELELNRPTSGRIELQYFRKLDPLSAASPTNGILTEYPNLYLYGCLAMSAARAHDLDQEVKWQTRFDNELLDSNQRAKSGRFGPARAAQSRGSRP